MQEIRSPMAATVVELAVAAGQAVRAGDLLAVVEAMKMEHELRAPHDGRVLALLARPGELLAEGDALLRLGAPVRVGAGGAGANAPKEIVLSAGPGGHFSSAGTINGKTVQFMVDTGATSIAMSQSEANRIGLDWQRGRRGLSQTAGGVVPVFAVNLTSVNVGGIEVVNVDAVVLPSDMPMVLLGNSFLSRFSMRREGDVMRLEKR